MDLFRLAADTARDHFSVKQPLSEAMRARAESAPREVFLLWVGVHSVLGVYDSHAKAEADLVRALALDEDAWIERREVR